MSGCYGNSSEDRWRESQVDNYTDQEVECSICGYKTKDYEYDHLDNPICSFCIEEDYEKCMGCEEYFHIEDMVDGYCEECRGIYL